MATLYYLLHQVTDYSARDKSLKCRTYPALSGPKNHRPHTKDKTQSSTCMVNMSDLLKGVSSIKSLKCFVLIFNLSIA